MKKNYFSLISLEIKTVVILVREKWVGSSSRPASTINLSKREKDRERKIERERERERKRDRDRERERER